VALKARQADLTSASDSTIAAITKAVIMLKPAAAYDIVGAVVAALNYAGGGAVASAEAAITTALNGLAGVPSGSVAGAINAYNTSSDHFQDVNYTTGNLNTALTADHPG